MPADASYDAVVRGALRLKKTGGSVVEKRSSGKRSKREKREREEREKVKSVEKERGGVEPKDTRTKAEIAHEEAFRKQHERRVIEEMANKSHKDKVREFNEKLSKLTEHNDLPKIGPG